VVEVHEFGPGGKVYTTYLPVRSSGKLAEQTSVELEAGDLVQVSGKLKYESSVDKRTSEKVSKMIVSSWGIAQRQPAEAGVDHAETSGHAEPGELSDDPALPVGQPGASGARKPRKRQYAPAALQN
jgi:single-stranded DNA-binding protein